MCVKTVTVDFDAEDKTLYEIALFIARLKSVCRLAGCEITKSRKGIHVRIDVSLGFWPRIALRSYLLDDPMRIEIDIERHLNGWHALEETLFNAKCQSEYCYSEEKISLEELEHILLG